MHQYHHSFPIVLVFLLNFLFSYCLLRELACLDLHCGIESWLSDGTYP